MATRDRPHLLEGLLDALPAALDAGCEVLVVDSASRDQRTQQLCRDQGVPVHRLDRAGTSRARNAGTALTTAPLVAFTDDDCRPQPGWAQQLRRAFDDPVVGLATGRVLPDRTTPIGVSLTSDPHRQPLVADSLLGHGANVAVRRAALAQVGGFDERLGPGTPLRAAEDQELFARVLAAGWSGVYEPDALVVHLQWRTRWQGLRVAYAYGVGAGATLPLRRAAWQDALQPAWRDARHLYATGVLAGGLRAAGAVTGRVRRHA